MIDESVFKLKIMLPIVCWLSAIFVTAASPDTLSLIFVGDLMQHQAQINAARKGNGAFSYKGCFDFVAPELRKADLAVGNLEVTLGGKPYRGYPVFSAPDEYLHAIRNAGFDVLLFANNHCLDRGNRGAVRTLGQLDSMRILHTGVFRNAKERMENYPLLVERKGFRIVFLNYTYDTNGLRPTPPLLVNYIDRNQIRKDIMKARMMRPDAIIACMHWGVEYELLPRNGEKQLTKFLLDLGVDHVIGGHPHVAQPLEVIADSVSPVRHLIAYSLGNFISNMSARHTDGGMMVKMVLKKVAGHTRMVDCGYSYVWTSRPELNRKGQFFIYPAGILERKSYSDIEIREQLKKTCQINNELLMLMENRAENEGNCLNNNEEERMKRFLDSIRKVIGPHTKGIKEYFF